MLCNDNKLTTSFDLQAIVNLNKLQNNIEQNDQNELELTYRNLDIEIFDKNQTTVKIYKI